VRGRDDLAGGRAGVQIREVDSDEIRRRALDRVGVIREVRGGVLVYRLSAEVDVRGLDQADAGDRLAVVDAAVGDERVGVVGNTGVGVHAAAVRCRARVLEGIRDLSGVAEAAGIPHVAEGADGTRR